MKLDEINEKISKAESEIEKFQNDYLEKHEKLSKELRSLYDEKDRLEAKTAEINIGDILLADSHEHYWAHRWVFQIFKVLRKERCNTFRCIAYRARVDDGDNIFRVEEISTNIRELMKSEKIDEDTFNKMIERGLKLDFMEDDDE